MTRLTVKSLDLIRVLERLGFRIARKSKGSHWQLEHADGHRTTVPVHQGADIGPGLLRKILRDIELSPSRLRELL